MFNIETPMTERILDRLTEPQWRIYDPPIYCTCPSSSWTQSCQLHFDGPPRSSKIRQGARKAELRKRGLR